MVVWYFLDPLLSRLRGSFGSRN